MPTCRTPGAHYGITIQPRVVDVRVCLPEALELKLTEADAIKLENTLHRAVEIALSPYMPAQQSVYRLIWQGKGPMPNVGVGNLLNRTENSLLIGLTREEMAWLADDWDFHREWSVTNLDEYCE